MNINIVVYFQKARGS